MQLNDKAEIDHLKDEAKRAVDALEQVKENAARAIAAAQASASGKSAEVDEQKKLLEQARQMGELRLGVRKRS